MPAEQRRDSIVRAAAPLVRRHGRAVTSRQLAEAAGVSEGTLFHVFPDKDAIIDAVVELELRPDRVLGALAAIDPEADLPARVVAIVEVLRRRLTGVFELMSILGMRRPPAPADHDGRRRSEPAHQEILVVIADLLRADADLLRYPPDQTAAMIRLVTFAASHGPITDGRPLAAGQIADLLLHGIATPQAHDLVGVGPTPGLEVPPC